MGSRREKNKTGKRNKLPKNMTINQHTVPQTWLRRFTYNIPKTKIYCYSKKGKSNMGSKPIEQLTTYDNFYDFSSVTQKKLEDLKILTPGDLNDKQYVEKRFFSYHVEDKLATLLTRVIENLDKSTTFSEDTKYKLSQHIAIQFFRTHSMRRLIEMLLSRIMDHGFNSELIENVALHHLSIMTNEIVQQQVNEMNNRKWLIYKWNEKDSPPFVISDNPVVFQKLTNEKQTICVPISSKYLIAMYAAPIPKYVDRQLLGAELDTVKIFNKLQYQQCEEGIYSSINDFSWIEEDIVYNGGLSLTDLLDNSIYDEIINKIVEKAISASLVEIDEK